MKLKIFIFIPLLLMAAKTTELNDIYKFNLQTIQGEDITLEEYSGNVLLIVNTASKCGYTPQYKELQKLHDTYKDQGFTVLGFPSGDFGGQELASNEEIIEFCEVNYGVEFPLFSKTSVKGEEIHPIFEHLTTAENSDFTGDINWNFEKFLIDRNGNLLRRFRSNASPMDDVARSVKELL